MSGVHEETKARGAMSDTTQPIMQDGSPAIATHVEEVQGQFPSNAAMQEAVSQLTLAGWDRAELSLPKPHASGSADTPTEGADSVSSDIDKRQLRTMGTGMAGYLGAAAAAGATIATGGAAGLAIAAATAVGVGAAAATNAGTTAIEANDDAELDRLAAAGQLILAVRAADEVQARKAMEIMKGAGATQVAPVTRSDQARTTGVTASGWTGG